MSKLVRSFEELRGLTGPGNTLARVPAGTSPLKPASMWTACYANSKQRRYVIWTVDCHPAPHGNPVVDGVQRYRCKRLRRGHERAPGGVDVRRGKLRNGALTIRGGLRCWLTRVCAGEQRCLYASRSHEHLTGGVFRARPSLVKRRRGGFIVWTDCTQKPTPMPLYLRVCAARRPVARTATGRISRNRR